MEKSKINYINQQNITIMKTQTLNFTELKNIINISNQFDLDKNELLENIESENIDFEIDNYRFINSNNIDEIQKDELQNDLYILGCFNADFLANILDIDVDVIVSMQEAEAYEAIGKLIISLNKIDELQSEFVSADGYGHHFSHYDGNENEVYINKQCFYVFRVN